MLKNLKKYWWLFALVSILLFSYYIRSINIVPDRLLSFDPIFQYRYTYYIANYGHLPIWDELTYYVGRLSTPDIIPPFMYYITSLFYWIFGSILKLSLMTVSSYMSAIYGALITIPAFLLVKELSNNYGGLLSAALIGTAPQILVRTFGSSYDTDQLVLFFIILTLYLGFRVLKKRTVTNFSLAIIGFSAFMLTWTQFWYTFIIILVSIIIYLLLEIFIEKGKVNKINFGRFKKSLTKSRNKIFIMLLLFLSISVIGIINNINVITDLSLLIGFAQKAEQWIVNISIAELQPFSIFDLRGWITAMGNFFIDDMIINSIVFLFFISMLIFGIMYMFKKDLENSSFIITLFLIAIYTSFRGIRFTEFTSGLFIILVGSGFGILTEIVKNNNMKKTILFGFVILITLIAMNIGIGIGKQLGPDINLNWDSAWTFLKTQTSEFSIVGTWWDPGHMITGLAERRVYADGAHCQLGNDGKPACLYTINDRIADLGKIMVTSDENESLKLIRKYQGDSPKVYWIASDDLIGKFQWLQYFGTGCDARIDNNCPLYFMLGEQSRSVDNNGDIVLRNYGNIIILTGNIPVPIFIQGINAVLFDEIIYYDNGEVKTFKPTQNETQALLETLKPLERQLNIRFTNQTMPLTVWIPQHFSYIAVIPKNLRNNVFTKMFMLEGQGLEHFKQVFRNEQVKIYEVI